MHVGQSNRPPGVVDACFAQTIFLHRWQVLLQSSQSDVRQAEHAPTAARIWHTAHSMPLKLPKCARTAQPPNS
jgi:hypothetical protein